MVAAALDEVAKTKAMLPANTNFAIIGAGLRWGRTGKDAKRVVARGRVAEDLLSSNAGPSKALGVARTGKYLQVGTLPARAHT